MPWNILQDGARLVDEVGKDIIRMTDNPLDKLGDAAEVASIVGAAIYRYGDIPFKVLETGGQAMWGAVNMPADLLSPGIMYLFNPQYPRGSRSLFVYQLKKRLKIPIKPKVYPAKQKDLLFGDSFVPMVLKTLEHL